MVSIFSSLQKANKHVYQNVQLFPFMFELTQHKEALNMLTDHTLDHVNARKFPHVKSMHLFRSPPGLQYIHKTYSTLKHAR